MNNVSRLFRWRWPFIGAIAVLLAIASRSGQSAPAEEFPFRSAIEYAQARTVKIYGAGIGRESGYGSGILVSDQGEILTANGIYLAGERLRIVLPQGDIHFARLERRSTAWQLALLKIDAKTPNFFDPPSAVDAQQGDWVLAVSNVFRVAEGSEPVSVTRGLLSCRAKLNARRGTQDFNYADDALLLDTITSNSGAAGGALVNAEGKLLGLIGKVVDDQGHSTRVNYAVPVDILKRFLAGETGEPTTKMPLATPATSADWGIRLFSLGGKHAPAFVDRVVPNSLASAAGLRTDDLILSVAGKSVRSIAECEAAFAGVTLQSPVELQIKRRSETLRLELAPPKKERP